MAVAEGRGPETPQPERLGPLLPRRVTCLVGVPQLFAVVAELCPAALTPTGDLWAAGTAKRNDCITEREKTNISQNSSEDWPNTKGQQG